MPFVICLNLRAEPTTDKERMIVEESISLDTSQPGLVGIYHFQIEDSGIDMGGSLWLQRESAFWVVDSLNACLNTFAFPGVESQLGSDSLKVFESGPEQAPIINLRNRRPAEVLHGGVFVLMMSRPAAKDLSEQLSALR